MQSVKLGNLERQEALKLLAVIEPQFLDLATKVTRSRIEILKKMTLTCYLCTYCCS